VGVCGVPRVDGGSLHPATDAQRGIRARNDIDTPSEIFE
jgi:hypothetical protein